MCKFWIYEIFHLPIMHNVDYFLRMDDDSEFKAKFNNPFLAMKTNSGKIITYACCVKEFIHY